MDAPATAADATLLARARAGDAAAWSELLEAYRPPLTLLAQVQIGPGLRGKADAADVVQETFLEAHRDLPDFRGTTEAEFAAWLRQILTRNLANLLRRYFGTQARDPRLWARLTHIECWPYMRKRWDVGCFSDDPGRAERFVLARYFVPQAQSRAACSQVRSRLFDGFVNIPVRAGQSGSQSEKKSCHDRTTSAHERTVEQGRHTPHEQQRHKE